MTSYTIKSRDHEGSEWETPIKATSDVQAITKMRTAIFDLERGGIDLFLAFYRESDGQRGYINPDGSASATGKSWTR